MRSILRAAIICWFVLMTEAAYAGLIVVNTGPGPATGYGWTLDANQWLAAEFTVTQAVSLTSIEGWIGFDLNGPQGAGNPATFTIALYGDGGNVPNQLAQLFSTQISVSGSGQNSWYGATGLNWTVSPGAYWVAFEVRSGNTLSGWMPNPSPNPLSPEAVVNTLNSSNYFQKVGGLSLGTRIEGNPLSPVPEPSLPLLLGIGLAAGSMAGWRFKA